MSVSLARQAESWIELNISESRISCKRFPQRLAIIHGESIISMQESHTYNCLRGMFFGRASLSPLRGLGLFGHCVGSSSRRDRPETDASLKAKEKAVRLPARSLRGKGDIFFQMVECGK
jgi:hypothetical protein